MRKLSAWKKLVAVNALGNKLITYKSDRSTFRKADYWASPLESLARAGDCEDYAILKYVSLRALGFRASQLRIIVVKDRARGIGHAVLSVKLGGETYILDNQLPRPVSHRKIRNYMPIYSVNASGRWLNLMVRKRTRRIASKPTRVKKKVQIRKVSNNKKRSGRLAKAQGVIALPPLLPIPQHTRNFDSFADPSRFRTNLVHPVRMLAFNIATDGAPKI